MQWTRTLTLVAFALIASGAVDAKDNPSLADYQRGIAQDSTTPGQGALKISSMHVDVRAHGRVADVTLEARLANGGGGIEEARFALALPPDAVVTGYALDVGGKMIDGNLLDQPKARNVYEDEVRQGIDPGLAEVSEGDLFQTRIYPITRDQSRVIRVSFAVPFGTSEGFVLPLQTSEPVEEMTVDVTLRGYKRPPRITIGGRSLDLTRQSQGWAVHEETRNQHLTGALAMLGGEQTAPLLVSHHHKGAFFQISDSDVVRKLPTTEIGRLRVYWDRSLSRREDLLEKERDLLTAYVEAVHPEAIDLVTFASDAPTVTTVTSTSALRDALTRVLYRGGTRLAALDDLKLESADQCLLFSDGLLTVDSDADFRPDCRLSIIASASGASGTRLGRLAQSSQGQLLRLTPDNGAEVLPRLLKPAVAVVSAADENGMRLAFRSLPSSEGGWFVVGETPSTGYVFLQIAGLKKGLTQRIYRLDARNVADCDAAAALWASQRVAELADSPLSHDRMASLARTYQVASPTMAFLVLERPDQYLRADIRPPASFSPEWMEEYREAKRQRDAGAAARKAERLQFVLEQWKERKAWWTQRFTARTTEQLRAERARDARPDAAPPPAEAIASLPAFRAPSTPAPIIAISADSLEEVQVTGSRVQYNAQYSATPVTAINVEVAGKAIALDIADVLTDQPYLKALNEASGSQRLQVLAEQEKTFGKLPAFYLETSEWFRLKGDAATAEALLYSALELPLADDETRQIVAFRLERDGQLDRAISILERIAATSDYRPQPKRALALALAERGRAKGNAGRADLQRAFELLTAVALEPAIQDFQGIETIALMEANSLIPAIEAVGGTWSLDRRLVAQLDTDLRIVIEWTNDDADVDLWVIEPNGEKVFYAYQHSSAGGVISNDMTDGYGPEEYLIHRAPEGEYQVRINGFDADRLNPNGNGRVMVRMIRDFSRITSRETFVDADVGFEKGVDRDDGGKLIARVTVEPQRGKAMASR